MEPLRIVYIALSIFGVGVMVVDLLGAFETGGQEDAGGGGAESDASDGGDDGDAGGDAGGEDGALDASDDDVGGGDVGHDDGFLEAHGALDHATDEDGGIPARGSLLGSMDARTRVVAKTIGLLRSGVYFSLGAGPTGLFALARGLTSGQSLLWGAGAGLFVAIAARLLRRFIRRDLDSSFKPEDFLLDEAVVTVPVAPGMLGKAAVRRYGAEVEVYIRAEDPAQAFARGERVRLIDYAEGSYLVEPADAEHMVR